MKTLRPVLYCAAEQAIALIWQVVVSGTNELLIYLGQSNGIFGAPSRFASGGFTQHSHITVPAANGTSQAVIRSIAAADFNGAGESDLAVTAIVAAVALLNATDSLTSSPIVTGRSDQSLTAWPTPIIVDIFGIVSGTASGTFSRTDTWLSPLRYGR